MALINILYPITEPMSDFYQKIKAAISALKSFEGGNTGQVFVKTSSTDYAGSWQNFPSSVPVSFDLPHSGTGTFRARKIGNKITLECNLVLSGGIDQFALVPISLLPAPSRVFRFPAAIEPYDNQQIFDIQLVGTDMYFISDSPVSVRFTQDYYID